MKKSESWYRFSGVHNLRIFLFRHVHSDPRHVIDLGSENKWFLMFFSKVTPCGYFATCSIDFEDPFLPQFFFNLIYFRFQRVSRVRDHIGSEDLGFFLSFWTPENALSAGADTSLETESGVFVEKTNSCRSETLGFADSIRYNNICL